MRSFSSWANNPGTSPLFSMLLMSSRKDSFTIWVSVKRNTTLSLELDLDALEAAHGGRKAGHALLAAAANAHKHGVAPWLAKDAGGPGDVLHCVCEEHEAHGVVGVHVVLLQVLFHQAGHLFHIGDLLVAALLRIQAHLEEIPKAQELPLAKEVVEGEGRVKVLADELHQDALEVVLVLQADKAVVVHAHALVHPKPGHSLAP
eukprot:CAMPEP_0117682920 /NCGR_PEP_ID=MMETSP0804-20121206/20017_1 /TAXON_ID=1074897 /ORGANISM="Tetraselmis astigmatica, Strain CCMP880" /LENGTH=202 /DNA_ID=CAMNT_0005493265 /DNA_START=93 /DNA_END=701 /DNA_ORIENTATION=-